MNQTATINNEEEKIKTTFSSGVYDDGFEALSCYLQNYASTKVCFLLAGINYLLYKPFIEKLNCKSVLLLSDDNATNSNLTEVSSVCFDCSLIVCMDYISVNFCKKLQQKLKINCFYFFQNVPPVDAFLPYYYEFNGKEYKQVACKGATNYIICYTLPKNMDRKSIIPCVCSIISYYFCFIDLYINSHIFGVKLSANYSQTFALCTKKLSSILKNFRFMPNDFIDELYALVLQFYNFIMQENLQTTSYCFASVYQYLKGFYGANFYEVGMLATQIFVHLYKDFFLTQVKTNDCLGVSVQKKQLMHAKFFNNRNFNADAICLEDREEMDYILARFGEKLHKKCTSFACIVDKLIDNALNLYADCGYSLYKTFDRQQTLNAIYFTPDFILNKSLLKVISNYGIFDNIKLMSKPN